MKVAVRRDLKVDKIEQEKSEGATVGKETWGLSTGMVRKMSIKCWPRKCNVSPLSPHQIFEENYTAHLFWEVLMVCVGGRVCLLASCRGHR